MSRRTREQRQHLTPGATSYVPWDTLDRISVYFHDYSMLEVNVAKDGDALVADLPLGLVNDYRAVQEKMYELSWRIQQLLDPSGKVAETRDAYLTAQRERDALIDGIKP